MGHETHHHGHGQPHHHAAPHPLYQRITDWKARAFCDLVAAGTMSDAFAWASADSLWHRALMMADGSVDLALTYRADAL